MEESTNDELPAPLPVLGYQTPIELEYAVIASFANEAEARLAACLLDSFDIDVMVATYGPGNTGFLKVLATQLDAAIEILKTTPAKTRLITFKS